MMDARCLLFRFFVASKDGSASVGMLSLDLVVRFCAFTLRQDRTLTLGMPQDSHWLRASDSLTLTKPHSSLVTHPNLRTFVECRVIVSGQNETVLNLN